MVNTRGDLRILACNSGEHFADKVIRVIEEKKGGNGIKVRTKENIFANTESKIEILDSIRGTDLYIFQDVSNSSQGLSVADNFDILKSACDAAHKSDANIITAVIPTFPFARSDKQFGREGISAARAARELEDSHADHIITLDVHNDAIEGFFRTAKFENLKASKIIMDFIKGHPETFVLEEMTVNPPDLGGAKRGRHYATRLGIPLTFCYKDRDYSILNSVEKTIVIGDVKNRIILAPDDMVDTAGTFISAIYELVNQRAKGVWGVTSLPFYNGEAVAKLKKAYENKVLLGMLATNVTFLSEKFKKENLWHHEVPVERYFAKVINHLNQRKSISALLD